MLISPLAYSLEPSKPLPRASNLRTPGSSLRQVSHPSSPCCRCATQHLSRRQELLRGLQPRRCARCQDINVQPLDRTLVISLVMYKVWLFLCCWLHLHHQGLVLCCRCGQATPRCSKGSPHAAQQRACISSTAILGYAGCDMHQRHVPNNRHGAWSEYKRTQEWAPAIFRPAAQPDCCTECDG